MTEAEAHAVVGENFMYLAKSLARDPYTISHRLCEDSSHVAALLAADLPEALRLTGSDNTDYELGRVLKIPQAARSRRGEN
jgi:hypothetical protein